MVIACGVDSDVLLQLLLGDLLLPALLILQKLAGVVERILEETSSFLSLHFLMHSALRRLASLCFTSLQNFSRPSFSASHAFLHLFQRCSASCSTGRHALLVITGGEISLPHWSLIVYRWPALNNTETLGTVVSYLALGSSCLTW